MTLSKALDHYRLLGKSGLRVSPLALGAMTFGREWGWGATEEQARQIFDVYLEQGGNFIDTANHYTNGTSEEFIGRFAASNRHRLVIATKFSMTTRPGDPNSGGNHRKSMLCSVEASLKRLQTDYLDLLFLHFWDGTTSGDEILRGLDDLVRAGKVLYLGISDTSAWQVARMQVLAELRGWSAFVGLQAEYNLIERTAERDLIPMARELGLGVIPWSPLANGVLTGKYSSADIQPEAPTSEIHTRHQVAIATGSLSRRGIEIASVVKTIAKESGVSPAQVALAWTMLNPAVTAPIMGVRTLGQLLDNLAALQVKLDDEQQSRLAKVSAFELGFPHDCLARLAKHGVLSGGLKIEPRIAI